ARPDPCPIRRYRGRFKLPDAIKIGTGCLRCLCRFRRDRGQEREEAPEDGEEDDDAAAIDAPGPLYHPRSATTALLRCRRSATIVRAPANINCSPSCAPAWLPPTKPTAVIPAVVAAATPPGESPTPLQAAPPNPKR